MVWYGVVWCGGSVMGLGDVVCDGGGGGVCCLVVVIYLCAGRVAERALQDAETKSALSASNRDTENRQGGAGRCCLQLQWSGMDDVYS